MDQEKSDFLPEFVTEKKWYESHDLDVSEVAESSRELWRQKQQRKQEKPQYKKYEPQVGHGVSDAHKVVSEGGLKKKEGSRTLQWKVGKGSKSSKSSSVCTNCGSSAHNASQCLEKAHKRHNKKSNFLNLESKSSSYEVRDPSNGSYDTKRDNYYGYDAQNWQVEAKKQRQIRQEAEAAKQQESADSDEEDEAAELLSLGVTPDAKILQSYKQDTIKAPGEKTVRLIEDKAKYLQGISGEMKESSEYDEEALFVKGSDAVQYEKTRKYAWNHEGSLDLNPEASPTMALLAAKKVSAEAKEKKQQREESLKKIYGD